MERNKGLAGGPVSTTLPLITHRYCIYRPRVRLITLNLLARDTFNKVRGARAPHDGVEKDRLMRTRTTASCRYQPLVIGPLSVTPASIIFLVLGLVLHGQAALAMQLAFVWSLVVIALVYVTIRVFVRRHASR